MQSLPPGVDSRSSFSIPYLYMELIYCEYLFRKEARPEIMGRVLGIVYRVIATHPIKKAVHCHATARTGAVTLIQRFGSALNLNMPQGTFS